MSPKSFVLVLLVAVMSVVAAPVERVAAIYVPPAPLSISFPPGVSPDIGLHLLAPQAGECLKGGSSYTITWKQLDSSGQPIDPTLNPDDHYSLAYVGDGTEYPLMSRLLKGPVLVDSSVTPLYFAHPIPLTQNSYTWNVPSTTTDNAIIYLEHHTMVGKDGSSDNSMGDGGGIPYFAYEPSSFSIDASPPMAPTLSLKSKTTSTAVLSWSQSADTGCKGLAGYKIYRSGVLVKTLTAGTTSFTDTGLSPAHAYSYKITAYDDFASADSSSLSVTTNAPAPTPTPTPQPTVVPTPVPTPTPTPVPLTVTKETVGDSTYSSQDAAKPTVIQGKTIHLEGTGPANATVVLTVHSTPQTYETNTDATGHWAYDVPTTTLATGNHTITATVTAADGTEGASVQLASFSVGSPTISPTPAVSIPPASRHLSWLWVLCGVILLLVLSGGVFWLVRRKKRLIVDPQGLPKEENTGGETDS